MEQLVFSVPGRIMSFSWNIKSLYIKYNTKYIRVLTGVSQNIYQKSGGYSLAYFQSKMIYRHGSKSQSLRSYDRQKLF